MACKKRETSVSDPLLSPIIIDLGGTRCHEHTIQFVNKELPYSVQEASRVVKLQ